MPGLGGGAQGVGVAALQKADQAALRAVARDEGDDAPAAEETPQGAPEATPTPAEPTPQETAAGPDPGHRP